MRSRSFCLGTRTGMGGWSIVCGLTWHGRRRAGTASDLTLDNPRERVVGRSGSSSSDETLVVHSDRRPGGGFVVLCTATLPSEHSAANQPEAPASWPSRARDGERRLSDLLRCCTRTLSANHSAFYFCSFPLSFTTWLFSLLVCRSLTSNLELGTDRRTIWEFAGHSRQPTHSSAT